MSKKCVGFAGGTGAGYLSEIDARAPAEVMPGCSMRDLISPHQAQAPRANAQ